MPPRDDPVSHPNRLSPWLVGLVGAAFLAVLAAVSLGSGAVAFPLGEILDILQAVALGDGDTLPANRVMILWDVRLPRIITAAVAGAALGVSGRCSRGSF